MQFPRLISFARQLLSLALAALLIAPGWAQDTAQWAPNAPSQSTPAQAQSPRSQAFDFSSYSKPSSHFPNPIGPYIPRKVEAANLSNTPRIDQLMQNGKLMLSKSGQATRGVNTGVVQGTPGGTPTTSAGVTATTGSRGGGAGGTTAGAGGAGTGSSGLVTSTLGVGAPVPSFDPILTGTLQ